MNFLLFGLKSSYVYLELIIFCEFEQIRFLQFLFKTIISSHRNWEPVSTHEKCEEGEKKIQRSSWKCKEKTPVFKFKSTFFFFVPYSFRRQVENAPLRQIFSDYNKNYKWPDEETFHRIII